jgi:hypothetical protein
MRNATASSQVDRRLVPAFPLPLTMVGPLPTRPRLPATPTEGQNLRLPPRSRYPDAFGAGPAGHTCGYLPELATRLCRRDEVSIYHFQHDEVARTLVIGRRE